MMKVPKKIVEKYFSFSNILYVLFLSDFCRVSKNRRHCLRVNHREKRADCQTGALQCEHLYAAKCGIILFQFPVLLIRNSLTPFVGVLLARNFDGFFAFLLIVAASGHAYKVLEWNFWKSQHLEWADSFNVTCNWQTGICRNPDRTYCRSWSFRRFPWQLPPAGEYP